MPPDPSTPARATVRVLLEAEVVVEFDRFSGFLAEYSSNLSLGGMFLTTRYLKPVGSELRFELRLKDAAAPLVRGRGMVAWTRWQDQGPRRPAGMGVRFIDLDAESHALVYKIVEERLRAGQIHEELALDSATLAEVAAPPSVELPPAIPDAAFSTPDEMVFRPPAGAPPTPIEPPAAALEPPALEEPKPVPSRSVAPPLDEIVARATAAWSPPAEPPRPPVASSPGPPPKTPAARDRDPSPVARPQPPRPPRKSSAGALWVVLALVAAGVGGWWMWKSGLLSSSAEVPAGAPPARSPAEPPPKAAVESSPAAAPPARQPAPPAAPAPVPLTAADGTPASPLPTREPPAPSPVPVPPLQRFTGLEKVTWSEESGFTEVVLWMDGAIPADAFERSRIDGKEPRELVRLRGASRPLEAGRYDVGTPEVRRVRTGLHGSGASAELHVVLDLAAGARVFEAKVDGNRLLVRAAFR